MTKPKSESRTATEMLRRPHNAPKPDPSTDAPWPGVVPPPNGIRPNGPPTQYSLIARKTLLATMDGKGSVDWETYIWSDPSYSNPVPHAKARTNPWFKATLQSFDAQYSGV